MKVIGIIGDTARPNFHTSKPKSLVGVLTALLVHIAVSYHKNASQKL